jgi:hypothetical protein
MASQRTCNRCGAPVEQPLDPTPRLVVVPAASPSTQRITKDLDCQIGLVTGPDVDGQTIDYCPPCLLSVVLARLLPTAQTAEAQTAFDVIVAQRAAVASVEGIEAKPIEPDPVTAKADA